MTTIYFLQGFNNYFNRQVIFHKDISEYLEKAEYDVFNNINFNPGDGVQTTLVVGGPKQNISGVPSYLVVLNDYNRIESRWFVIDAIYLRNGQYKLQLKRDSIVDNYDSVLKAPVFVERGMLNYDNPLIYNNEGNTFNRIKTKELLLKDETKTNWIVGYVARNTKYDQPISSVTSTERYPELDILDIDWNDIQDFSKGGHYSVLRDNLEINTSILNTQFETRGLKALFAGDNLNVYKGAGWSNIGKRDAAIARVTNPNLIKPAEVYGQAIKDNYSVIYHQLLDTLEDAQLRPIATTEAGEIQALNQQVVYSSSCQKYYRLVVNAPTERTDTIALEGTLGEAMKYVEQQIFDAWRTAGVIFSEYPHKEFPFEMVVPVNRYSISLVEVSGPDTIKTKISNGRQHLIDAPFDMFAIPYSEANLNLASVINLELATNILDLQLLPYCPVRKLLGLNGIDLSLGTEGKDYDKITDAQGNLVSYILWAARSSASFSIPVKIAAKVNPIELKVQNECEVCRLSSPNYNGIYEFSVAKNKGVDYFEVNFTYKPYSPYIHVAPNFKGLYGSDFDDARGLICNGDFSIAMTSDAWRTYEVNNKNYQNIFNTEIKTMDTMHEIQRGSNIASMLLNAGTAGLGVGFLTGNPMIGAGAGGASLVGGIADTVLGEQAYNEQRKAKGIIHDLQLGNIKARPNSLTKISAYNVNNKYFPFVEFYSATEEEKQALREKIKYEGMLVNAHGTMADYSTGFFKGELIRLKDIKDDSHIVNDIYNELKMGVYLNEYTE